MKHRIFQANMWSVLSVFRNFGSGKIILLALLGALLLNTLFKYTSAQRDSYRKEAETLRQSVDQMQRSVQQLESFNTDRSERLKQETKTFSSLSTDKTPVLELPLPRHLVDQLRIKDAPATDGPGQFTFSAPSRELSFR